jgi:hypothetical protein
MHAKHVNIVRHNCLVTVTDAAALTLSNESIKATLPDALLCCYIALVIPIVAGIRVVVLMRSSYVDLLVYSTC